MNIWKSLDNPTIGESLVNESYDHNDHNLDFLMEGANADVVKELKKSAGNKKEYSKKEVCNAIISTSFKNGYILTLSREDQVEAVKNMIIALVITGACTIGGLGIGLIKSSKNKNERNVADEIIDLFNEELKNDEVISKYLNGAKSVNKAYKVATKAINISNSAIKGAMVGVIISMVTVAIRTLRYLEKKKKEEESTNESYDYDYYLDLILMEEDDFYDDEVEIFNESKKNSKKQTKNAVDPIINTSDEVLEQLIKDAPGELKGMLSRLKQRTDAYKAAKKAGKTEKAAQLLDQIKAQKQQIRSYRKDNMIAFTKNHKKALIAAGIGTAAATAGGIVAYKHFKNKKKKEEEESNTNESYDYSTIDESFPDFLDLGVATFKNNKTGEIIKTKNMEEFNNMMLKANNNKDFSLVFGDDIKQEITKKAKEEASESFKKVDATVKDVKDTISKAGLDEVIDKNIDKKDKNKKLSTSDRSKLKSNIIKGLIAAGIITAVAGGAYAIKKNIDKKKKEKEESNTNESYISAYIREEADSLYRTEDDYYDFDDED